MKFPSLPIKGRPVKDTIREILNYIRSSRITSVVGGRLVRTPSGTAIHIKSSSGTAGGGTSSHFKVSGATYDSGAATYQVTVRGGYFLIRDAASGSDALKSIVPTIDVEGTATPLPPESTQTITLTNGQGLFLKVETDHLDVVKPTDPPATPPAETLLVTIVAATESETGTHNQPEDDTDTDGTDGVYYYPLAKLDIDGGDPEIVSVEQVQQGGPIIHTPPLWMGENIGGGANIWKDRDTSANTYRFRSVKGGHGVDVEEADTEAIPRQNNENIGGANEVWVQPVDGSGDPLDVQDYPDGTSKLRTIRNLYTDEDLTVPTPQIYVTTEDGEDSDAGDADTIRVRGNSYVKSVTDASKITMSVKDGLIESLAAGAAPTVKDLNLTVEKIVYSTADLSGNDALIIVTGATEEKVLYWRDGLFLGDVDPADSPAGLVEQTVTHLEEYGA